VLKVRPEEGEGGRVNTFKGMLNAERKRRRAQREWREQSKARFDREWEETMCLCGCGRSTFFTDAAAFGGRPRYYATDACRQRAYRRRKALRNSEGVS
jgi:hypothetical protein